ncbi:hypothetical protein DFQ10_105275 [Winogradskyella eximia]|jgi:hypothetical protein|uniref:Hemerythrin HHE cation binding domain-containing protein n=1 Tax=Winogradskyella eximia TaxID=262006 RepID=A0A3D9H2G5_9FLAO|nr:hypothetical protein [Winogradskyella eximia]RED43675.1 hypothetical protein DFQ10_105275 [Winogradskyella eximia]
MKDFRIRPKDNYINEASWEQLYVLTEHWKSDLVFYHKDLRFLHLLIDKYFMWISNKENIDMVYDIEMNLLEVDKQCALLLAKVNSHLHHLAELVDDPLTYVSPKFREEHQLIEDEMADFVKVFRNNRKEIFKVTEYMIDKEKMVQQLDFTHTKN